MLATLLCRSLKMSMTICVQISHVWSDLQRLNQGATRPYMLLVWGVQQYKAVICCDEQTNYLESFSCLRYC